MAETQDQLLNQIYVLKMKIKGRINLSHGDEIKANVFSVFRKQILEYINETEICICKQMFSSSEKREETESDWLAL